MNTRYRPNKLQTAFDSDNIYAYKFALKCGFKLARRTYCFSVNKNMLVPFK